MRVGDVFTEVGPGTSGLRISQELRLVFMELFMSIRKSAASHLRANVGAGLCRHGLLIHN